MVRARFSAESKSNLHRVRFILPWREGERQASSAEFAFTVGSLPHPPEADQPQAEAGEGAHRARNCKPIQLSPLGDSSGLAVIQDL
jgi:hypothetical protein